MPNLAADTESWVAQFETFPPRRPQWVELLDKLQSTIGKEAISLADVPPIMGCVRIIDRKTRSVRYEKEVPAVFRCRLAMDGKLLIVDNKPATISLTSMGGPVGSPPPPPPFEIYRTDVWPRWIWTTLGVLVVILLFAWLARRRHLAVWRKLLAPVTR